MTKSIRTPSQDRQIVGTDRQGFSHQSGLANACGPLEETDDAFVVEIELPGVKRDDVDVELTGRRLTVRGERKERERVGVLRRRTRRVGEFHYEVTLPDEVSGDDIEAHFADGLLTIRAPKAEGLETRQIRVS